MNQAFSDQKNTKHTILILYILLGGIILFLVNKAPIRNSLYGFYSTYEKTNSIQSYSGMTDLPIDIQEQMSEITSYQFFKEHKYAEAIQAITGQSSRSYYNLGTLKTVRAYNQALGNTLSGLQAARYLIADAYKDFDTADQIKLNNSLDEYIQNNKALSQKLGTVIQVKACYGEYNTTISSLQGFLQQLDNVKSLLAQEQKEINVNRSIDTKCKESLRNINTASKMQLGQLQNKINDYNKTYKSDFVKNIQNPMGCLESNMGDIGSTLNEADTSINTFADNHKNTIAALLSQDKNTIKSLCEFVKNDSQINEEVDSALNKLLQQLQNNLDKKQQKSQKNQEKSEQEDSSQQDKNQSANTQIEYKNVFEEDELKLLQQIDTNNKSLIQQIQQIKGEGRYKASKFLNKLFEDFYGEKGVFDNILETSGSQSKR